MSGLGVLWALVALALAIAVLDGLVLLLHLERVLQ